MAYGFRLNVEAIYWREAIKNFGVAEKSITDCDHRDPVTMAEGTYKGYSNDEALASACMAVVCFAICVEAATNFAWNEAAAPQYPTDRSRKKALRSFVVWEKLEDISQLHGGMQSDGGLSVSKRKLDELFEIRNKFVHFKEIVEFQPFGCAAEAELLLQWSNLVELREVSRQTIEYLSRCSSLDASFLSGDAEVVTVLE